MRITNAHCQQLTIQKPYNIMEKFHILYYLANYVDYIIRNNDYDGKRILCGLSHSTRNLFVLYLIFCDHWKQVFFFFLILFKFKF